MNHQTKKSAVYNAPFGTDIQPMYNVKIIGGKAVEIPVECAPASVKSGRNLSPINNVPQASPKEYQINDEFLHNKHSKEQYERLREIVSKTSPSDNSNSHIHEMSSEESLPGALRILPPIPKSNTIKHSFSRRSPQQTSRISSGSRQKRKTSMTMQLHDLLKDYDVYCFKEMYVDLAEFDHRLTGYVNQSQVNMIALKHHLPIPTTVMRLLFTSFAKSSNPDMINYEKLLQYLGSAKMGLVKAETMLNKSVDRFIRDIRTLDSPDHQVSLDDKIAEFEANLIEKQPFDVTCDVSQRSCLTDASEDYQQHKRRQPLKVFSERDDSMLLMLVEQQVLQGKEENIDLELIKNTMSDYDQFKDGTISHKQFQDVCLKHRLPFQGSLLDKIIMRCDTGQSKLSWVAFIEFLSKLKLKSYQDKVERSPKRKEGYRPGTWPVTSQRTELAENLIPVWETRKPLGPLMKKMTLSSNEQDAKKYDTFSSGKSYSSKVTEDTYQQKQLNDIPKEEQALEAEYHSRINTDEDNETEPWFSRFMHLAHGLYNSDSTNTGYLAREEILRLVNNYNLVYNLKIPEERIMEVISNCTTLQGYVMIEPVLESLRYKCIINK